MKVSQYNFNLYYLISIDHVLYLVIKKLGETILNLLKNVIFVKLDKNFNINKNLWVKVSYYTYVMLYLISIVHVLYLVIKKLGVTIVNLLENVIFD